MRGQRCALMDNHRSQAQARMGSRSPSVNEQKWGGQRAPRELGRLTLNVLLSFAQFEREVTGERIRDKIAASKKKGIWMGGVVPLGYRVESQALRVVEDHAAFVRDLFRRYLEIGSVVRLNAVLNQENIRLPIRTDGRGRMTGGGLISRGHLYKILSNPIYVGRLTHKGPGS